MHGLLRHPRLAARARPVGDQPALEIERGLALVAAVIVSANASRRHGSFCGGRIVHRRTRESQPQLPERALGSAAKASSSRYR